MRTSDRGLALIREFEGFVDHAYLDPVGIWTIGYGFTARVRPGDKMTRAEADKRLREELGAYEAGIILATGGNTTQQEFDALASFAWNVGINGMQNSTAVRLHNKGDKQGAAEAFKLWNKAGGKVLNGLVRRRKAEAEYYLTGTTSEVTSWILGSSSAAQSPSSSQSSAPGSVPNESAGQKQPQTSLSKTLSGLWKQISALLPRK